MKNTMVEAAQITIIKKSRRRMISLIMTLLHGKEILNKNTSRS
jgi:hypothetical protein